MSKAVADIFSHGDQGDLVAIDIGWAITLMGQLSGHLPSSFSCEKVKARTPSHITSQMNLIYVYSCGRSRGTNESLDKKHQILIELMSSR